MLLYILLYWSLKIKMILKAIQKVCHPPPPLSHFVTLCLDPLPPLVTSQIVTNFELIMSWSLMQILDLILSKMSIFSTQTLSSTLETTSKSRSGVFTTFKVILMRLLKRYFFEVVTSLFYSTPPPCHTLSLFCLTPLPS